MIGPEAEFAVLHGAGDHEPVRRRDGCRVIRSADNLLHDDVLEGRYLGGRVHVVLLEADAELGRVVAAPPVHFVVGHYGEEMITATGDALDPKARKQDLRENLRVFIPLDDIGVLLLLDGNLSVSRITRVEDLPLVG